MSMATTAGGLALQYNSSITPAALQRPFQCVAALVDTNQFIVGSKGALMIFDAVNNTRQAVVMVPKQHSVELLHVMPDQARVIVVCAEWTVYMLTLSTMAISGVMDLSNIKRKGLRNPLCCTLAGRSAGAEIDAPVVLVTSMLKDSVRSAYLGAPKGLAAKKDKGSSHGSKSVLKELQPGHKLMLTQDKNKGVVALAAHPLVSMLFALTANGELHVYQHAPGSGLQLTTTFSMLLEESKVPTKQVAGAYLGTGVCPRQPTAMLLFIFLPGIHIFYIMSHRPGEPLKPFQRFPWLGCDHVLSVEISQRHDTITAIAGLSQRAGGRGSCRYTMRIWTVLGEDGDPVERLRLQARNVSQRVRVPLAASAGIVAGSQPEWATLWTGTSDSGPAVAQQGHLDVLSVAATNPATKPTFYARHACLLPLCNRLIFQYANWPNAPSSLAPAIGTFQLVDFDHPTMEHPSAIVSALHTTPLHWIPVDSEDGPTLMLPHALPFLQGNDVRLHVVATQDSRTLVSLPTLDGEGRSVNADMITHSTVQHCALVFATAIGATMSRVFACVDVSGRTPDADAPPAPQYFPGVMGTFAGPTDAVFAVLESNKLGADNMAVYNSQPPYDTPELLYYTYLERGVGDSVIGVWPAPPATAMLYEPTYDENGEVMPLEDEAVGEGLVALATRSGGFLLALLPAAADAVAAAEAGEDLLPVTPQFEMQLLPNETVCQVAWTFLVPREQVGYPSHCLGAVLTTHRVILVDGQLTTLQSVALTSEQGTWPSRMHAATSLMWVGPALLVSHASGRVEHVSLTGKRTHVCSVMNDGECVLCTAAGDRLNFLQRRGDVVLVTARKVYVAPLLVQGWLSLLLSQHAYGTWPNVRLELSRLARHYDIKLAPDVASVETILASGCGDLLPKGGGGDALLSGSGVSRVAHAAASGDWEYATQQVLDEYQASPYAPCAPPPGSHMRQVLATVALGAMSQGKWKCAERCLGAAGETLLQLLMAALQHDRPALHKAAAAEKSHTAGNATLAALLLAADGRIGLRQQLHKDWVITRPVQDTDASTWQYANMALPLMHAYVNRTQRDDAIPQPGEEGPIPPLWTGGLAAHLGLTFAQMLETAPVLPTPGTPIATPDATGEIKEEEPPRELTPEERAAQDARDKFFENFEGDSMFGSARLSGDEDAPSQLISVDKEGDEDDDDSSIASNSAELQEQNIRKATAPKFRIQIKQGEGKGGAGQGTGDIASAVKNLTLGPPGALPMGASRLAKVQEQQVDDTWQDLGLPAPAAAEAAVAADDGDDFDPFAAFSEFGIPDSRSGAIATQQSGQLTKGDAEGGAPPRIDVAPAADAQQSAATSAVESTHGSVKASGSVPDAIAGASHSVASHSVPASEPMGSLASAPRSMALDPPSDVNDVALTAPQKLPDASSVPGFSEGINAMFSGQWAQAGAAFSHAFSVCHDADSRRQIAQYAAVVGLLQVSSTAHPVEAGRLVRHAASMPLLYIDHISMLVNDAVSRNLSLSNFDWCKRHMETFVAYCKGIGRDDIATGASGLLRQCKNAGSGDSTVPANEHIAMFVAGVSSATSVYEVGERIAELTRPQ